MNITRKDLEDSIVQLSITLDPSDYSKKFEQKLASNASKAAIKGFRKGKTPTSVIKKMYGQSILGDLIDELFNQSLTDYIKDNEIKFIAQPLFAEDQEKLSIDLDSNKSYTLTYELGVIPEFSIKGISSTDSYDYFKAAAPDDLIETEMKYLSRRLGKLEEVEDIQVEDLVTAHAVEMENGAIKEGGYAKDVMVFTASIEDEEFKKILLSKKINEEFTVEIGKLENKDLTYIKKHILGLPEEHDLKEEDVYHFTVKKISRLKPAELTDEIIKEKFQLEGLDELKVEILKNFEQRNKPASDSLLQKAIMDKLLNETNLQISDTFVKNWLRRMENLDEEKINTELDKFKKELKWTYIKDEISKDLGIELSQDDIRSAAANRIRNYESQYGKLDQKTIESVVKQWYSDKNEYYSLSDEARTNKMFNILLDTVQKNEKTLSSEEFDKLFNPVNE